MVRRITGRERRRLRAWKEADACSRSSSPIQPLAVSGELPLLTTLRAPDAVPSALLGHADRFPTKFRIGVERLSGLAGRVLASPDADGIWEWLCRSSVALRAVRRAVVQECVRLGLSADVIGPHLNALLAPPFDALRKRAESLRELSDDDLMLWDAAPLGSREWIEVAVLDEIREHARLYCGNQAVDNLMAAAEPPTHACPRCMRDVSMAARGPNTTAMEDEMRLIVYGPCYHKACYDCLLDMAEERGLDCEGGGVLAALEQVVRAGSLQCPSCDATVTWPWHDCGRFTVKPYEPLAARSCARRRASN
mmetsp:Transcript_11117/g.33354  ORF Transcript_11117/g.33354 Transcript_11117/m.33354 type:complete len:308 (-) Transcript_11117:299-1222(-)